MRRRNIISLYAFCLLAMQGCIIHTVGPKPDAKTSKFQQMNFQDLINRYMKKGDQKTIEGVYSVSGMVMKNGKNMLGVIRDKTTDRKENYATVAILRDEAQGRDFIELSLNSKNQASYSIVGEFNTTATGNLLVYKHFDSKGKDTSYTFTRDENSEILEGVRVINEGAAQITFKLTYVKLAPK